LNKNDYLYGAEIQHSNLARIIHYFTFADTPTHRKIINQEIIFLQMCNGLLGKLYEVFVSLRLTKRS